MRKQRWCGALLALALCLTLLPGAALAVATTNDITGSGTKSDPYLIYTAEGLEDFRNHVNGTGDYYGKADPTLCAQLKADIVLNDGTFGEDGSWSGSGTPEPWTPIGDYNVQGNVSYTGTFDGGGKTIKGLYINSKYGRGGLFMSTENATIQNLTVTGYVKGDSTVGGIVGQAIESSIQNCVNYSTVTGSNAVGGIVGRANGSSTIQNCINLGNVTGKSTVGGIVGHANGSSTIQNCINLGNVTGKSTVGGLVGSFDRGSIQNCANLGGVKGSEGYTGGIVGYAVNSTTMTACYNVGKVEGTGSVGGLVGYAGWYNPGDNPGDKYMSVLTASNCYYLNTAATEALGSAEHFTGDTSECSKTKTEFANELLSLLQNGDTNSPWTKYGYLDAANMTLPLLSGQSADTHDHSYSWQHNGTEHWKECECGLIESGSKAAHSGGTATCTAQAVCETCGSAYGPYHPNLTHINAVAATTTTEGNIEYWYCPDCGKYFKDDKATVAITQAETVTAKLPGSTPYYPPSYAASVSETEHGSVTVSPKSAAAGTTVTVTVTPDQGYTLETLTVTDASGKELPLTDQGGGRFTFTQPASKVTVRATFMDDNTMLNFFADVKASDYYYDAVLWAAQKGITSGISAAEFGPNQPCTRAQIVTFLWRAAGSPVVNYAMSMDDVNEGSYYAEAVRWALSEGITAGTAESTFSPNSECTRAQAVTFLARALNAKASGKAAFSDVPSGSYYADAVAWAAESGVTTGTSADAFSPDDVCTRAQIVTFLYRAFQ